MMPQPKYQHQSVNEYIAFRLGKDSYTKGQYQNPLILSFCIKDYRRCKL